MKEENDEFIDVNESESITRITGMYRSNTESLLLGLEATLFQFSVSSFPQT